MNLSTIQADLYGRLSYKSSPETEVVNRLLRFINETQREIIGTRGCQRLRRQLLTFASVANSPFAVLPQAAVKIIVISDRTNGFPLDEVSLQKLRVTDPQLAATGNPYTYTIVNLAAPVAKDPSDASQLFVKSDSASDGATKTAYIEGITTGGYYRTASVALNGITAAGFTPTDFIAVTKFYLALTAGGATTAAGVVTLYEDSGTGTALAAIPVGRSYARYSRIQLYPTPTSAITYHADVELHIEDMATAGDEPYLPEDFHWLINCGTLMKEYLRRKDFPSHDREMKRWKEGMSDLKLFLRPTTGVPRGPQRPFRYSQLGPNYPPGS